MGFSTPVAHAQSYTEHTLYGFSGNASSDGAYPQASLINVNGTLYGTTHGGGGSLNDGTVFAVNADGTGFQTLHNFTGGSGGIYPYASLIAVSGKLYGTTGAGGTNNTGTVFALNTDGTGFQTLYSFGTNTGDGANPYCSLIAVGSKLYGTTYYGGSLNDGTVFSLNTDGTGFQTVYSLDPSNGDGINPEAGLVALSGKLYGTTYYGGSLNDGTVFSLNTDGTGFQTLYSFTNANGDGANPYANLIVVSGTLYGTTVNGGSGYGTVFSLDPDGTNFQALHDFDGSSSTDGANPYDSLIAVSGKLYGTTYNSGAYSYGMVFSLNTDGTGFQTVYSFGTNTGDGSNSYAGLVAVSGKLYGTASLGGTYHSGTIFSLTPVPPVAKNDAYATKYQTKLTVAAPGVLSNDNTETNGPITATLVTNVSHGTLTLNSDGSFTYTPANGFGGNDSFTYQVGNGFGKGNTATVTLTVQPVVPVAANDTYALKYATPYAVHAPGVLANDNTGGGTLTATLVTNVAHGTLTLNADGSFTYTPSSGFVGTDTFTYKDTTPAGTSNTATVSLIVQAVVPVAHNDAYAPVYSHAYKVNAPGVLSNDYAGDTGSLTAKLVSTVSHGALTLNSDGSFLYSPTFEYSGTDSFTYTATNAIGTSNTATVTFTITPVVPIAHNDAYTPKYATAYGVSAPGVLGNDDDGGTSPMTAALVSNVTHGTLTFNSNGSFTYTPSAGFVGTDSFTYKDTTPTGTGNTATVTLNVTAALPVAHNDSYTLTHNKAYAVKAPGVLGNDYAGDSGSFTASLVSTTTHGILTFNADGSFTYTPTPGFTGTDTFTYQAVNAIGTSNTATVTLTVQ